MESILKISKCGIVKKIKNSLTCDKELLAIWKFLYNIKNYNNDVELFCLLKNYSSNHVARHVSKFGNKVNMTTFERAKKHSSPYIQAKIYLSDVEYLEYCKNQTRNNRYDPQYIAKRDNISIDDAIAVSNELKRRVSTKLDDFIYRYGIDEGTRRYKEFCIKSDSRSFTAIKERHPENYMEIWNNRFKYSKRCVEYWLNKGEDFESAKKLVSLYQKMTSGVHFDYLKNKGMTNEDINSYMIQLNNKKSKTLYGYTELLFDSIENKKLIKMFFAILKSNRYKFLIPDDLVSDYNKAEFKHVFLIEHQKDFLSVLEQYTKIVSDFRLYVLEVNRITKSQNVSQLENYGKIDEFGNKYHLDHKFSKKMGFLNNVPEKIIGNIVNLEYIPKYKNISKHIKCSITIDELMNKYEAHKNEN